MDKDKFKRQIESIWKHRDTDEQKRLLKFGIAKTMRLTLTYPKLAQEYYDSLCKVIPDNERITVSNYHHNLTSDVQGEEMLTVSRKRVQEIYTQNQNEIIRENVSSSDKDCYETVNEVLKTLFGSKCLPDEAPKPAEPRFKVGDIVRVKGCGYEPNLHKGDIGEILDTNDKEQCFVLFKKSQAWIYFDCLEPYSEPKENHIADPGKMVDAIIKDGFSKERRLNIAAMAMQGILANATWTECKAAFARRKANNDDAKAAEILTKELAEDAAEFADALIKETEKKGGTK